MGKVTVAREVRMPSDPGHLSSTASWINNRVLAGFPRKIASVQTLTRRRGESSSRFTKTGAPAKLRRVVSQGLRDGLQGIPSGQVNSYANFVMLNWPLLIV